MPKSGGNRPVQYYKMPRCSLTIWPFDFHYSNIKPPPRGMVKDHNFPLLFAHFPDLYMGHFPDLYMGQFLQDGKNGCFMSYLKLSTDSSIGDLVCPLVGWSVRPN